MRLARVTLALSVLSASLTIGTGAATAASRAVITFRLPAQVDAGTTAPYTFAVTGLPAKDRLVLQRQTGSRHVWRTVRPLAGKRGHGTTPVLSMGRFSFRIVAVDHHGRVVLTAKRTLSAYGPVTLQSMCAAVGAFNSNCNSSVRSDAVGPHVFTSIVSNFLYGAAPQKVFAMPATSCRNITVQFGVSNADANVSGPEITTATLVQSTLDPVTVAQPDGGVGTLSTPLDGQPWELDANFSSTEYTRMILINATASCYTLTGRR